MKAALIGTGKTGGRVLNLLDPSEVSGAFNDENLPTKERLAAADVIIVFVPGDAVSSVFDMVLESGTPAVWGSTGFQWPDDLDNQLKTANTRWVIASNFSLGMNIVRHCIQYLSKASALLNHPEFHIHEVHHTAKKDAPSGTALSWKKWLDKESPITSAREGDVKGIHELTLTTQNESIQLKHEALSRDVFAEGAIWTARYLTDHPEMDSGLYPFEMLIDQTFEEVFNEFH